MLNYKAKILKCKSQHLKGNRKIVKRSLASVMGK